MASSVPLKTMIVSTVTKDTGKAWSTVEEKSNTFNLISVEHSIENKHKWASTARKLGKLFRKYLFLMKDKGKAWSCLEKKSNTFGL